MTGSALSGMGATAREEGIAFRVWAPFAHSISVAGDFNDWSTTAHPLSPEGNGYWFADVADASIGQQYRYYIVGAGGNAFWKTDPYAREVTWPQRNAIIHQPFSEQPSEHFTVPPRNELIIYELHVGTFCREPSSDCGTFQSAAAKLPYLQDLGINAIEVMPICEFGTKPSLGYNPVYPFAVELSYGGVHQFREFVTAAHKHGIAVIVDLVYNHFGPEDLHSSLWRFDGWSENDKGGIYFYNDWRATTPWGETRPDYGRAEVRQYLRDSVSTWLESYRADGLRWDATAHIRNVCGHNDDPDHDLSDGWELMRQINDEIDAGQRRKLSIAEDLKGNEWITKDTSAGGAGFDAQWDAGFGHTVRRALNELNDADRDMSAVADVIKTCYNTDVFERVVYTESHDNVRAGRSRVPEEIWPGKADSWAAKKRSTLGAALVFTAPGIPMIFQGQEFLESGTFEDTVVLDWERATTHAGILNLYRDLCGLRRNWHDTTHGLCGQHVNVYHVNNVDKVIAFHRWNEGGPGDDVVVIINMGSQPYAEYEIGFPRQGAWKIRFNSDWEGYSADFGNHPSFTVEARTNGKDGMRFSGSLGIGPYTAIILSQVTATSS